MVEVSLSKFKEEFLGERWLGYYLVLGFLYLLTFYYSSIGINSAWYDELNKPSWDPGVIIISIIGIVIYILSFWGLFIAFDRIAENPVETREAYDFFMITITITTGVLAVWTYFFYFAHQVGLATIFMLAAFVLYFAVVVEFLRLDFLAGALNIPYLLWLGYFFVFSLWIYLENPSQLRGV